MGQLQKRRVQRQSGRTRLHPHILSLLEPSTRQRLGHAVQPVTEDRNAFVRQVDANLMGAPRPQLAAHTRAVLAAFNDPHVRSRRLAVQRHRHAYSHRPPLVPNRPGTGPLVPRRHTANDRIVGLCRIPIMERRLEETRSVFVERQGHDAGRVSIQAVNDMNGPSRPALPGKPDQRPGKVRTSRVNQQARGFVHDHHSRILMQNGRKARRLGRGSDSRNSDPQHLSATQHRGRLEHPTLPRTHLAQPQAKRHRPPRSVAKP